MANLGQLEHGVMDALWQAEGSLTAYDIAARIAAETGREPAATTVLTVLSRLERKGFVTSDRSARPHRYLPVATRADHMAELMHAVLGDAGDRGAVLERFVGGVTAEDAALLRQLLDREP